MSEHEPPSPEQDIEALAAEYVLGTLDEAARNAVAARRRREPRLHQAINAWEQRLSPLSLLVKPVVPPPQLFDKLMQRIEGGNPDEAKVIDLTRKLQRWRRMAVTASALAASLLVFIGVRVLTMGAQPQQFVAVLQQSDTSPAFLVSVDLQTRELTVRAVAAQAQPGKSYELWLVNNQLGAPRSLGVVNTQGVSVRPALARYDAAVVRDATYAISLEPEGGSPTGSPTGPVLYTGKLLEMVK